MRLARELGAERLDVFADFGVVEDLVRIAQAAHDHASDLSLVLQGQHGLRRAADIRQIVRIVSGMRGGAQGHEGHQGAGQEYCKPFELRRHGKGQCGAGSPRSKA